jgi:hypothetical protein
MQIDFFINKITNGIGRITVSLQYVPKSIGHIAADLRYAEANKNRRIQVESVSGKDVTLRFFSIDYYNAQSIDAGNSGNAGGDPHSHGITTVIASAMGTLLNTVTISDFRVVYEVG